MRIIGLFAVVYENGAVPCVPGLKDKLLRQ